MTEATAVYPTTALATSQAARAEAGPCQLHTPKFYESDCQGRSSPSLIASSFFPLQSAPFASGGRLQPLRVGPFLEGDVCRSTRMMCHSNNLYLGVRDTVDDIIGIVQQNKATAAETRNGIPLGRFADVRESIRSPARSPQQPSHFF